MSDSLPMSEVLEVGCSVRFNNPCPLDCSVEGATICEGVVAKVLKIDGIEVRVEITLSPREKIKVWVMASYLDRTEDTTTTEEKTA